MDRERQREIFRSKDGQEYLLSLLSGMGLFKELHTTEEIEVRNAGIRILRSLGLLEPYAIRMLLSHFMSLDISGIEKKVSEKNVQKAMDYLEGMFPEKR